MTLSTFPVLAYFGFREKHVSLIDLPLFKQKKAAIIALLRWTSRVYDANVLGLAHGRQGRSHSLPRRCRKGRRCVPQCNGNLSAKAYLELARENFRGEWTLTGCFAKT